MENAMHPLQEKFQILTPGKIEEGESWTSFESTRDLRGMKDWCAENAASVDNRKFNFMPPGMELHNQQFSQQEQMGLQAAGATDVSKDTNSTSISEGFTRRKMSGTDDQYTGEHVDLFYGDAGGFAERNNYLDRE
jgi:hypothetical protein